MNDRDMLQSVRALSRPRIDWSAWRKGPTVSEVPGLVRDWLDREPGRRRKVRNTLVFGGPLLLVVLAVGGWLLFGPMMQPDYRKGNLRKVFTYTLLTDEFNRLPVEKRMELIGQLVQRLQGMSAGDSVLLASFAAGIAGTARKQIEENASKLAIDLWDKYAVDYAKVPEGDRAAFIDNMLIEFTKTLEALGGESRDISDTERLAEIRRQAERDRQQMGQVRSQIPSRAVGRMFTVMRDNVAVHAAPAQQARGLMLLRDVNKHLNGGKP